MLAAETFVAQPARIALSFQMDKSRWERPREGHTPRIRGSVNMVVGLAGSELIYCNLLQRSTYADCGKATA